MARRSMRDADTNREHAMAKRACSGDAAFYQREARPLPSLDDVQL